jgi:uroporphyrinogen decarboxylase
MTEIMLNCYDEPDLVHYCLEKVTDFLIQYIRAYKDQGVNGVLMAEPAAGLLSPGLFDQFSLQYIRRVIDAVQDENFALIYHNCGNTMPHISSIQKIKACAFHFGNAIHMKAMLEAAPRDMIIMGNIDPVEIFRNGTPESVYAQTSRLLAECAAHQNFIPSSGCDIPPLSPWENIDAFFAAIKDYNDML